MSEYMSGCSGSNQLVGLPYSNEPCFPPVSPVPSPKAQPIKTTSQTAGRTYSTGQSESTIFNLIQRFNTFNRQNDSNGQNVSNTPPSYRKTWRQGLRFEIISSRDSQRDSQRDTVKLYDSPSPPQHLGKESSTGISQASASVTEQLGTKKSQFNLINKTHNFFMKMIEGGNIGLGNVKNDLKHLSEGAHSSFDRLKKTVESHLTAPLKSHSRNEVLLKQFNEKTFDLEKNYLTVLSQELPADTRLLNLQQLKTRLGEIVNAKPQEHIKVNVDQMLKTTDGLLQHPIDRHLKTTSSCLEASISKLQEEINELDRSGKVLNLPIVKEAKDIEKSQTTLANNYKEVVVMQNTFTQKVSPASLKPYLDMAQSKHHSKLEEILKNIEKFYTLSEKLNQEMQQTYNNPDLTAQDKQEVFLKGLIQLDMTLFLQSKYLSEQFSKLDKKTLSDANIVYDENLGKLNGLQDILAAPFQIALRYKLLFNEIKKNTDLSSDSTRMQLTNRAYDKFDNFNKILNDQP